MGEDTGREFILPVLKRQMLFQNNAEAGQYWYAVLDGFDVPESGLRILSLPADTQSIVLALYQIRLFTDQTHG
jgi:hypothetical protein